MSNLKDNNPAHVNKVNISSDAEGDNDKGNNGSQSCRFVGSGVQFSVGTGGMGDAALAALFVEFLCL